MLTEGFICSTLSSAHPTSSSATNANLSSQGIFEHNLSPVPALRSSYKQSSTSPNCLALTSTHIFAAQNLKAVINVYNREKGNLEVRVPFNEKISSLAAIGGPDHAGAMGTLVLGLETGRLFLWELATGRTVSTDAAHLQRVNILAVDPTSNWIVSASNDSLIHVWAILDILSIEGPQPTFGSKNDLSPARSFSGHRAPITSLAIGHSHYSSNIAVSTSSDKVLHVWSTTTSEVLHTVLLNSPPQCVALDPADRAVFVGQNDGSVQMLDLQALSMGPRSEIAVQATSKSQWKLAGEGPPASAATSLTVSYDGTTLLSAHASGRVHAWEVGLGKWKSCVYTHDRPVSNIQMLRPEGLPRFEKLGKAKSNEVTKPSFDSIGSRACNHPVTTQFVGNLDPISSQEKQSDEWFTRTLCSSTIPKELIEEGVAALTASSPAIPRNIHGVDSTHGISSPTDDFRKEHESLMIQLKDALAGQEKAIKQCMAYEREEYFRRIEEDKKKARKKRRRLKEIKVKEVERKKVMGQAVSEEEEDVAMKRMEDRQEELSSDMSEITDSEP